MVLSCRQVAIGFSDGGAKRLVLRDLDFAAHRGEFVSILGPSGCGKTTLLRLISGYLKPDAGVVELAADADRQSPAVGGLMVYQEHSLFPWMRLLDNVCFGLEAQGVPRAERERRARPLLRRYRLDGREDAWPHQLSAGMKQRAAVIGSFLTGSRLLLMDEPFAALDCISRHELQQDLLDLWEQDHKTVVFVTHDIEEALLLSDRIVILGGTPASVVAELAVPFVRPRQPGLTLGLEFLELKREISRHFHSYRSAPSRAEPSYAQ